VLPSSFSVLDRPRCLVAPRSNGDVLLASAPLASAYWLSKGCREAGSTEVTQGSLADATIGPPRCQRSRAPLHNRIGSQRSQFSLLVKPAQSGGIQIDKYKSSVRARQL